MRSMSMTGFDELADKLEQAGNAANGIAKASLYVGAGVMADAMHAGLNQIKTEPFRYVRNDDKKRLPSPEEKAAALAAKFGVARHAGSGAEVDTVVGITGSGYVHLVGKSVPAAELLRSIQKGTSFMLAQPVIRKAISAAKGAASAATAAEGEARLQQLFNK